MGSWKMKPIFRPRSRRISERDSFRMSIPSKMIWPSVIWPGGSGTRRTSDSAVTLLPQPDSPTRPSVSP